jgi:MSHA biogenesis protein MshI
MQVRWPEFLRRKTRHDMRAGIAASAEHVALAVVRRSTDGKPHLLHCAVAPAAMGYADGALRKLLRDYDPGSAPVSAVIGADDYQLAQIPAPDVPDAEMRAAARWRMRDVIDFALDDSTVDVFDVPERRDVAARRNLFAVATRGDVPQFIAMSLQKLTRHLDVIDIPELCQRNLCTLLPQDTKGLAFVMLREDHAQLVLVRQGRLFVTRRFDFEAGLEGRSLDAGALALELQRSLDYYETHFDQPAITDLLVAPATALSPVLSEEIAALTGLKVHPLALHEHLAVTEGAQIPDGWLPTLAIGAALRMPGSAS